MGCVKPLLSPPRHYTLINVPVLCTILFLYVAFSQGLDTSPFIFKENQKNAMVQVALPKFPTDVPLIRFAPDSVVNNTFVFLYQELATDLGNQYQESVTALIDVNNGMLLLEYKRMQLKYARTYKCFEMTGQTMVDDCGFKLIVLAKPSPPTIRVSDDSSLLIAGTAKLDCEFESRTMPADHGLQPLVVWEDDKGNDVAASSSRISRSDTGSLIIPDISRRDLGMTFKCFAADDAGQGEDKVFSDPSSEFKLVPEYAPDNGDFTITPEFDNSTVIKKAENEALRYECRVDCQPTCKVQWKRMPYGKKKYTSVPTTSDPSVIAFDALSRQDQGSYICVGENEHGANNKGFILEVLYILTPEVVVTGTKAWKKSVLEGDGEEVRLSCFIDSNPQPSVTWKYPENWLINQSTLTGPDVRLGNNSLLLHRYTSLITLRDLKCEQGGFYTCQAENSLQTIKSGQIEVDVKCRPSAVVSGQYKGLEEGLLLQDEYGWDLGTSLKGDFIIRGWPSPQVKRVESSLNGITREESLQTAVQISTQHPYMDRPYLTLFSFQSLQALSMEDMGRQYKFILENADFETKFSFTAQPRGPPLPVSSLNTTEISHNSITLSWKPEFNGGERQTFSVFVRRKQKESRGKDDDNDWNPVVSGVEENENGGRVGNVKVKSLSGRTSYEVLVMSVNGRGNASASFFVMTKASPASSADAGAIVGAVLAVIIVLLIVGAVLFYFFVYKKRWGKDGDGESRIPMIGRMSKIFRGRKGDPNGNVASSSGSKRPIFTGKKSKPPKDYWNVPTESADPTDTEYVNADSIPRKQPIDSVSDTDGEKGDDDRTVTDEGLTYVKVDFRGKRGMRGPPPPKPKRVDNPKTPGGATTPVANGEGDACQYSSIDFEKTKAKEEMRRREKEEEEARRRKKLEEEEEARRRKEEEEAAELERGRDEEYESQPYENFEAYGTTV